MRRFARVLGACVAALGFAGAAQASPLYYTFEGTITSAYDITTGFSVDTFDGVSVGDPVSYTFLVDTALPGTVRYNGITTPLGGTYYADFVSGGPILGMAGGSADWEYNYGVGNSLFGSSPTLYRNYIQLVDSLGLDPSAWTVGQSSFSSSNLVEDLYGNDPNGPFGSVSASELTLTSITSPVPEPTTLALLGAGLVGVVALRRRRAA